MCCPAPRRGRAPGLPAAGPPTSIRCRRARRCRRVPSAPGGCGPGRSPRTRASTGATTRPRVSRSGRGSWPATSRRRTSSSLPRINGDFTGTTAEILRWAACKWGIDQDIVFAQAAVESWWRQTTLGDWESSGCPPGHGPGRGRQAGPVPAELGDPAEQVSLRAVELAGDRGLHRDERGHRVRDLAVLLRRLRDLAEHRAARRHVPGRRRLGLCRPLVRRALAHRAGPAVHRASSRSTCASGSGRSPTSSSLSPPPAGQFHVGEVQPEPGRVDDRFLPRFFHPMVSTWCPAARAAYRGRPGRPRSARRPRQRRSRPGTSGSWCPGWAPRAGPGPAPTPVPPAPG